MSDDVEAPEVEVVQHDGQFAKLQRGMEDPEKVIKATPAETARDWVSMIRAGDWSLADVEPRPYQDVTAEEMREQVRALLDAEGDDE